MFGSPNIKNVSANYVASVNDEQIFVDVSGGPVSITLPAIVTAGVRKRYVIVNTGGNAAVNNISILSITTDLFNNGNGGFTINTNGGIAYIESEYVNTFNIGRWLVVSGRSNFTNSIVWQPGSGIHAAEVIGNNTNRANGDYSTASGNNNAADADYSSAQGGDGNQTASPYGGVRGGLNNDIQITNPYGGIYSGNANSIQGAGGNYSVIFHGDRNVINSTGIGNYFWGGSQNNIYSGSYNHVFSNTGSSFYGSYGMATPGNQQIRSNYNFVSGDRALGFEDGARVHAKPTFGPGYFGVTQISDNLWGGLSTDATPIDIFDHTKYTLFVDQVRSFNIRVTAVQTAGVAGTIGDCKGWTIIGMIRRDGAPTFVGVPNVSVSASEAGSAAWTLAVTIDGNGMKVTGTGEVDKTINRLAHIDEMQTGYRAIQP